jgi:hypothetical protein
MSDIIHTIRRFYPHRWVKNWVKIASKSIEMLQNACKRQERISGIFFCCFKGI